MDPNKFRITRCILCGGLVAAIGMAEIGSHSCRAYECQGLDSHPHPFESPANNYNVSSIVLGTTLSVQSSS